MTTCTYCGRDFGSAEPCRNTRDMEESTNPICFTALMLNGGGERSENQQQSARFQAMYGAFKQNDNPALAASLSDARDTIAGLRQDKRLLLAMVRDLAKEAAR